MKETLSTSSRAWRAKPIGVFDSGVGGLSVLREVARQLPGERAIYFGDTAHVPYGGRPLDEVRGFALTICDYLVGRGAKMIIMACNISSAVALDAARESHPGIDVIGVIEPGAAAAVASGATRIGVIATAGTVRSGAYTRAVSALNDQSSVLEIACPKFVPLVEAGETESEAAQQAARECLVPLAEAHVQTIIHGCTHYPFLQLVLTKTAAQLFPPSRLPQFLDPACETVRFAARLLQRRGLLSEDPAGEHEFVVSGDTHAFEQHGGLFFGRPITRTRQVHLPEHFAS